MKPFDDDKRQMTCDCCKDRSSEVGFRARSWPEDASDIYSRAARRLSLRFEGVRITA